MSKRDAYGPEFDDRLICLVRENPPIYDVYHPHYRRTPVRIAIWDRIANKLGAPSKFLQTKWKNIRYNYLQEIKVLETGTPNPNIRKRRFTEDLSFLLTTAQQYNVKKTNNYNFDGDSNSYVYSETDDSNVGNSNACEEFAAAAPHQYDVIEIENSDDENFMPDEDDENNFSTYEEKYSEQQQHQPNDNELNDDEETSLLVPMGDTHAKFKIKTISPANASEHKANPQQENYNAYENGGSNGQHNNNNTASALEENTTVDAPVMPIVAAVSSQRISSASPLQRHLDACNGASNEITIEAIPRKRGAANASYAGVPPSEIMQNAAKRKAMNTNTPPVLEPINDPIELYCLSLVDSLRNMPRSERERVKFEFAKILKDAKYKDES